MQLPQIRLQSTSAKIGISRKDAQLTIEQSIGDLQIEQPKAELNIIRKPGKLTIDQSQARADVDLKSIRQRIEEAAQFGKQDLLEGIARRIREGNEMMEIEGGFQAIPNISKQRTDGTKKEFNIGFIPRAGSVKIEYVPGSVEIDSKINKPKINYQVNKPNIKYSPGEVNINLKQHASLKIDFE